MEKETKKSELEKTREYAKNEWKKYHPEEQQHPEGKNQAYGWDWYSFHPWERQHPEDVGRPVGQPSPKRKSERQKDLENEISAFTILAVIEAIAILVMWIVLFADRGGGCFLYIVLPATTSMMYGSLSFIIRAEEELCGLTKEQGNHTLKISLAVFCWVQNVIVSIVGFAIGGEYSNDLEIAAAMNLILTPVFTGIVLGVRSKINM